MIVAVKIKHANHYTIGPFASSSERSLFFFKRLKKEHKRILLAMYLQIFIFSRFHLIGTKTENSLFYINTGKLHLIIIYDITL